MKYTDRDTMTLEEIARRASHRVERPSCRRAPLIGRGNSPSTPFCVQQPCAGCSSLLDRVGALLNASIWRRLAGLLKTSPQFWMRLQADWDLHRALALRATRRQMRSFNEAYDNPLTNAAYTFIEPFPVGLLVTVISGRRVAAEAAADLSGLA